MQNWFSFSRTFLNDSVKSVVLIKEIKTSEMLECTDCVGVSKETVVRYIDKSYTVERRRQN